MKNPKESDSRDALKIAEDRLAVGVHRELEAVATSADEVSRHANALAMIDIAKTLREIRDMMQEDRDSTPSV
ncbi:MAG: hypothetical protein ISN26_07890 [Betaproteobacteria bacterium AqS2]|uniref:Uncharacterized protein n=1 Tax=Candidatus Amphirhobacter heronislandensis TaxID=1732024 RepID=A0A930UDM5_9GAMM|nr:hypothetical protein [Betaproteobacteria bacterium AqS2]